MENIGSDLTSPFDLFLGILEFSLFFRLQFPVVLIELRLQDLHCIVSVLVLRSFALAGGDDSSRQMDYSHR